MRPTIQMSNNRFNQSNHPVRFVKIWKSINKRSKLISPFLLSLSLFSHNICAPNNTILFTHQKHYITCASVSTRFVSIYTILSCIYTTLKLVFSLNPFSFIWLTPQNNINQSLFPDYLRFVSQDYHLGCLLKLINQYIINKFNSFCRFILLMCSCCWSKVKSLCKSWFNRYMWETLFQNSMLILVVHKVYGSCTFLDFGLGLVLP